MISAGRDPAALHQVTPVVDRLAQRVLEATVVRTDATGLKVLDPTSAAHIERGTVWCYVGDDRDVVFRYTPTGEGETGPWTFLAGRVGYVQADAASVFDRVQHAAATLLADGHVEEAVEVVVAALAAVLEQTREEASLFFRLLVRRYEHQASWRCRARGHHNPVPTAPWTARYASAPHSHRASVISGHGTR